MIDKDFEDLSIVKQCQLLSISRSGLYYRPRSDNAFNQHLMRLIDQQQLKTPFYGSRQMTRHFKRQGYCVGRKRIRRLMRKMGITPIYPKPKTSIPNQAHKVYPYLLNELTINDPDQVWCADITFIPMEQGHLYLVAIMDWHSRKVLSWRLSNTQDTQFCVEALEEAIECYGKPDIFNTDQGSQFTSIIFTDVLKENHIRISMDGKGRWMDNIFIERLWRSLKYECVYLNAFESIRQAQEKINHWINFYNQDRPHSSLNDRTPNETYFGYTISQLAA
jgi:putative transposase